MLATEALRKGDIINEDTLASIMPNFSEQRATFLAQEFELECPSLHQIIRSFGDVYFDHASFTATTDAMRQHLTSLPSSFSIQLRGETISPADENAMFRLWNFLYNIGLFFPRVSDKREPKGYRHIYAEDQPIFVHPSKWNEMQAAVWEIHPAFRDFMIQVSQDKSAKFGLPRKDVRHQRTKR
jgi:hypothetical protein